MFKKTFAGALLLLFANFALAQVVIVVHPSNTAALDSKLVQRIFLGKEKKFSSGSVTVAVNQSPDSSIRQTFDQDILGRSSSQVSAYWSKLVFTGKGVPPKEVSSDVEMIELVSQNPSVIGYIDRASATDAVKIVEL
jgi:ABC-type phosphate transport system substrate-binding protein